MTHIKDHQGQLDNLDDVSSYLKSNGFTDNEISSAYSWVLDQMQPGSECLPNENLAGFSFRILNELERRNFAPEAIGYLLQLKHLGLLTDSQIELVLERGTLVGPSPVDLEQMKLIIGSLLFREPEYTDLGRSQIFLLPDDEGLVN
jgi:Smg protein